MSNPTIQLIAKEALDKMRIADSTFLQPIIEVEDSETANVLTLSGEFCQPRLRNSKDTFVLIRRKK